MTDPTRTEHRWLTPGVRGIGAASFLWPPAASPTTQRRRAQAVAGYTTTTAILSPPV